MAVQLCGEGVHTYSPAFEVCMHSFGTEAVPLPLSAAAVYPAGIELHDAVLRSIDSQSGEFGAGSQTNLPAFPLG